MADIPISESLERRISGQPKAPQHSVIWCLSYSAMDAWCGDAGQAIWVSKAINPCYFETITSGGLLVSCSQGQQRQPGHAMLQAA